MKKNEFEPEKNRDILLTFNICSYRYMKCSLRNEVYNNCRVEHGEQNQSLKWKLL